MDFVVKMMIFVLTMMNFVSKMMIFVSTMMDFVFDDDVSLRYRRDQHTLGIASKKHQAIQANTPENHSFSIENHSFSIEFHHFQREIPSIQANKSKHVQAALSAKQKAASLPLAGDDGVWDLRGQEVKDTDVTALMDTAERSVLLMVSYRKIMILIEK